MSATATSNVAADVLSYMLFNPTRESSPRTPYNRRERTQKRVLVNGRWVQADATSDKVRAWLQS